MVGKTNKGVCFNLEIIGNGFTYLQFCRYVEGLRDFGVIIV